MGIPQPGPIFTVAGIKKHRRLECEPCGSRQQDLYRELSVGFSGYNDDSWSGSLGGRMSGRMGELSATISNSHQRNAGSASSLTAGYSSSLALSRNGLFWGGGQDGEPASGMAVNVESEGTRAVAGK